MIVSQTRDEMVGAAGFELATLCSQSRCATRLRYAPKKRAFYRLNALWSIIILMIKAGMILGVGA